MTGAKIAKKELVPAWIPQLLNKIVGTIFYSIPGRVRRKKLFGKLVANNTSEKRNACTISPIITQERNVESDLHGPKQARCLPRWAVTLVVQRNGLGPVNGAVVFKLPGTCDWEEKLQPLAAMYFLTSKAIGS